MCIRDSFKAATGLIHKWQTQAACTRQNACWFQIKQQQYNLWYAVREGMKSWNWKHVNDSFPALEKFSSPPHHHNHYKTLVINNFYLSFSSLFLPSLPFLTLLPLTFCEIKNWFSTLDIFLLGLLASLSVYVSLSISCWALFMC